MHHQGTAVHASADWIGDVVDTLGLADDRTIAHNLKQLHVEQLRKRVVARPATEAERREIFFATGRRY